MLQILNDNHWDGRQGYQPRWIILHGTAGGSSAQAVATFFQSTVGTANPASTNYVIGQDGTIVQTVSEDDAAYANGVVTDGHDPWWSPYNNPNPNWVTISIEHVKPSTDNSDDLTPEQKAASFSLVQDICDRWNIPKRKADAAGGITGHFSMDPVNRARCPGSYPWDELWTFLSGEDEVMILQREQVASYFPSGDDQIWKCKNGHTLGHGMLTFYRSFGNKDLCGLTYLGLPLTDEYSPQQNLIVQRFERGVLAYDPKHLVDNPPGSSDAVYLMHIDIGPGKDPQVDQLKAQVGQLQEKIIQIQSQTTDQTIQKYQERLKHITDLASSPV